MSTEASQTRDVWRDEWREAVIQKNREIQRLQSDRDALLAVAKAAQEFHATMRACVSDTFWTFTRPEEAERKLSDALAALPESVKEERGRRAT